MNRTDIQFKVNTPKESILQYQFQALCACLVVLLSAWAIPSTFNLPSYINNLYYLLSFICFLIYFRGLFNLNAFIFLTCYSAAIISSLCLIGFLIGLLSHNPKLIQQGIALGLPYTIGYPIATISIILSIRSLYRLYGTVNLNQYIRETMAAHNYDLEEKQYFINQPNKEPELTWKLLDQPNKSIIIMLIALLIPYATSSAYITIMSQYHPFTLNHIIFFISLPAFMVFSYATLSCCIRYLTYKKIQLKLGTKLKPAVKK